MGPKASHAAPIMAAEQALAQTATQTLSPQPEPVYSYAQASPLTAA